MVNPATSTILLDGCNMALMRAGSGPPVLVLHGGSGASAWLPYMAKLAEMFDVIVPEHPGFGASDTPDWLDNIHDLAYFYLDFMDRLDLRQVHLVGLSLGGWIGVELAVRDTARLASLTLVGAAGIHVNGVEQIDPFLRTDEQRIRDFFHDPKLADDFQSGARYAAARSAARAGCGQGEDAKALDDQTQAGWRKQALDWLRADLALWSKQLDGGEPDDRRIVGEKLQYWQKDAALAGVRDAAGLAKLPADERKAWRRLWTDVQSLLDKAGEKR